MFIIIALLFNNAIVSMIEETSLINLNFEQFNFQRNCKLLAVVEFNNIKP